MQDKVPPGPSRTPRPAHPAQLAADRLMVMLDRYRERLTFEQVTAFHTVRKALWQMTLEDEK